MYSIKNSRIIGRWNKKAYTPVKTLGSGGIGKIYLVRDEWGRIFALKISTDLVSITKEYRFLKKFGDKCLSPKVYELDDCNIEGKTFYFFIMEYIEGFTLKEAIKHRKLSLRDKVSIVRIISSMLKQINSEGYVYTDLKHENIMIDKRNGLIRLIDLGSIVRMGDAVKEYTAMYDRKSWGMGTRVADTSYQMFTIMILFITLLLGNDIEPGKDRLEDISKKLRNMKLPEELNHLMDRYLNGSITNPGMLYCELGEICLSKLQRSRLTQVLDIAIAFMSLLLVILIGTIFT